MKWHVPLSVVVLSLAIGAPVTRAAPAGACCLGDVCEVTGVADCDARCGVFHGFGTECLACPEGFCGATCPPGELCEDLECHPSFIPYPCDPDEPVNLLDVWESRWARVDFGEHPIPSDFFVPGSDEFTDAVSLEGSPIDMEALPNVDTLVRRMDPAQFDEIGSQYSTDTEFVELSMFGPDPLHVVVNGVSEDWIMAVGLSPTQPSTGTLTATLECKEGGTFDSTITIYPAFVFVRLEDINEFLAGTRPIGEVRARVLDREPDGTPITIQLVGTFGFVTGVDPVDDVFVIPNEADQTPFIPGPSADCGRQAREQCWCCRCLDPPLCMKIRCVPCYCRKGCDCSIHSHPVKAPRYNPHWAPKYVKVPDGMGMIDAGRRSPRAEVPGFPDEHWAKDDLVTGECPSGLDDDDVTIRIAFSGSSWYFQIYRFEGCEMTPVPCPMGCDDGDPCTTDACVDGECVSTPVDCPRAGEVRPSRRAVQAVPH